MVRAQRVVDREPFPEEFLELVRQAHDDVGRRLRACRRGRFEHLLDALVRERGHYGRNHHAARHTGAGQRADHVEPALRAGRARLEPPRQRAIEAADGHVHLDQPPPRHRGEQVEVALDEGRLGHQRERMVALGEYLEEAARDAVFALDRLVAVGIRAECDRAGPVVARGEFFPQQLDRVDLGVEARLEIQARRELEVRMARPRIAIDAAVLAAAIGIDRLGERDVRGIVARNDGARVFLGDLGLARRGKLVFGGPAVVERFARFLFESALRRIGCATRFLCAFGVRGMHLDRAHFAARVVRHVGAL